MWSLYFGAGLRENRSLADKRMRYITEYLKFRQILPEKLRVTRADPKDKLGSVEVLMGKDARGKLFFGRNKSYSDSCIE